MTMRSSVTQGLRRAAQTAPGGLATVDGARRRDWTEVLDRVGRMAGALTGLGFGPDDRAAVIALNSDRYFELHFSLPWAGGALVPINVRLAPHDVAYILDDCAASLLFVDETGAALVAGLDATPKSLRHTVFLGDGPAPDGMHGYEELLAGARATEDVYRTGDDLAAVFYTSGSTGRAKGVMLSHENLVRNAMNGISMIGYDPTSIYLHVAPMFHVADIVSTLAVTMVGGTHIIVPKFEVLSCLEALATHRVTNLMSVPTMIGMLVNAPETPNYDLSALRQIMFGSSPMPDGTLNKAVDLWPDLLFAHGWGMTELAPLGTMLPREFRLPSVGGERLRSCGKAPLDTEVMIVDPDGHEVPRGETGELVVRGPGVMVGYLNMPEETAEAFRGGWLHSGDVAYMDEEGFVYIVDRLKDMISTGAENVYSTEVENAISVMPGVREVAVIGVPDEKWGERVHAVIVPADGVELTEDAVRAHCRSLLAAYKCPRSVEFRTKPLPLSSSGKILKTDLREPYWQGRERRVN